MNLQPGSRYEKGASSCGLRELQALARFETRFNTRQLQLQLQPQHGSPQQIPSAQHFSPTTLGAAALAPVVMNAVKSVIVIVSFPSIPSLLCQIIRYD